MILLLAIFVLWAGEGRAGETESINFETILCSPSVPCAAGLDGNLHLYQLDENGYVKLSPGQSAPPSQCELRMRAAMEEMEQHFYYKHGGEMIFPFKPKDKPIPADVGLLIDQWAEVKRECWKGAQ